MPRNSREKRVCFLLQSSFTNTGKYKCLLHHNYPVEAAICIKKKHSKQHHFLIRVLSFGSYQRKNHGGCWTEPLYKPSSWPFPAYCHFLTGMFIRYYLFERKQSAKHPRVSYKHSINFWPPIVHLYVCLKDEV